MSEEKENPPSTGGKDDKRIVQEGQSPLRGREYFEENTTNTENTPQNSNKK